MSEYARPLPEPDDLTRPFWDAARRHELVVQRCADCGKLRFPPAANCPRCSSEAADWAPVSGRGTVFSYVVVHHAVIPSFADRVPYNVARVSLEDDPDVQLHGDVVNATSGELSVGMPVRVVFDDVTPEDTIPRWEAA
jgi:uncharacterized OB-fold protein